jgi:alpha-N-arabinofuranosidase
MPKKHINGPRVSLLLLWSILPIIPSTVICFLIFPSTDPTAALKLLDPSLILILCGQNGTATWDYYTLKQCLLPAHSALSANSVPLIDMHSIHMYTSSSNHLSNATAPLAAERAIEITSSLIDLARIENGVPADQPRPTICFDEWNVWDPIRAEGSKGAEESYTLSDALAVGIYLNVFVRKSRDLGMACIAQSVNVISPLMATKDGITKQTSWWPLLLFSQYMQGWTVGVHVSCGAYEGKTSPAWVRSVKDTPWLDVSAASGDDGFINMVVINVHETRDLKTEVQGAFNTGLVNIYTVTGSGVNVTNMKGTQEVGVKESTWDGMGGYIFPRHSLTLLRWKAE